MAKVQAMATPSPPSTILLVDDDASILEVLAARLESAGFATVSASSAEEALQSLAEQDVNLIISDMRMPGMGGAGLLKEVVANWPGVPVILLTAYGAIPDAVSMVKDGAADYLTKPFDGKELVAKVKGLLERKDQGKAPGDPSPLSRVLWGGKSASMRKLYTLIERVAPSEVNVLMVGESGTGKEMVARLLHEHGPNPDGPLVIVDCGSTPATLLESELFGHVKGSFTHAVRDKKGLIEEAKGGTLFLDEVGNVSPEMQTRLLRFLQEHTIRRIGDTKEISVKCRVVAATNADLQTMVREGSFREDLYFRLKGVALSIPPLRERKEDIPLLVERFVAEYCRAQNKEPLPVSQTTMDYLVGYPWPGNVRELKHAIEAGIVLCNGNSLAVNDLQLEAVDMSIGGDGETGPAGVSSEAMSLDESEKQAIIKALEQAGWVQTAAADILGISRRAIHYKIKKYDIRIPGRGER